VWCNSDVVLTADPFSLDDGKTVRGFHRREIPAGFLQGERIVRFHGRFLTCPYSYNRLLMSACFYRSFRRFPHILVCQLDCLVFRDELEDWCAKDFDYVGSLWLDNYSGRAVAGV